jgi:CRP-like cAMP-binding protein
MVTRRSAHIRVDAWLDVFSGSALWPAGSFLCQQGADVESVFLLQEGLVKIVATDDNGDELIVSLEFAPAIIGVAAAILGGASKTSAVAATPCRVRYCTARAFRAALETESHRREIQRVQSVEIETLTNRLSVMALKDAEGRFVDLLRSFCGDDERELAARVRLPLKHCEIASFLGITPEHLSRIVGRLVSRGVIRHQDGQIIVPDIARLSA